MWYLQFIALRPYILQHTTTIRTLSVNGFKFLSPTNASLYYTYKMLKYTVKISHDCSISVYLDHHQGAYAEPCESYNFVEILSKIMSLNVQQCW
jgi:hypothetical protein